MLAGGLFKSDRWRDSAILCSRSYSAASSSCCRRRSVMSRTLCKQQRTLADKKGADTGFDGKSCAVSPALLHLKRRHRLGLRLPKQRGVSVGVKAGVDVRRRQRLHLREGAAERPLRGLVGVDEPPGLVQQKEAVVGVLADKLELPQGRFGGFALGNLHDHRADAEALTGRIIDGVVRRQPVAVGLAGGRGTAFDFHAGLRLPRFQHRAQAVGFDRRKRRQQLRDGPAQQGVRRQADNPGKRVVDPAVAQVTVEERKADGGGVQQRVEQRNGLLQFFLRPPAALRRCTAGW